MKISRSWTEPARVTDFAGRFFLLNIGLFLYALGSISVVKADLGYVSWDVFHRGLSLHTPFTFGQAGQLVGLIIIVLGLFFGVKPGIGTVMNMLMIGFWDDLILKLNWIPAAGNFGWWLAPVLLGGGILAIGLGSGLYIKAGMGAGPRDGFMLGLSSRTGWRVAVCRTVIEVTVCLVGFLLGGPLGIGTLIVALTIGTSVEFGFWCFRVQDPRRKTELEASS